VTLLDYLPDVRATGETHLSALLGETQDTALTVLNPSVVQHSHKVTPNRAWFRATVHSHILLRGAHVSQPDTSRFDHALVRLAGLRDVCYERCPNETGEWVPFVTAGLGARDVTLRGRGGLLFRYREDTDDTRFRKVQEIDVEVVISPRMPLTIAEFDHLWLAPLESLTTLAARGPTRLEQFTLVATGDHGAENQVQVYSAPPALAADPPDEYSPLLPLAALPNPQKTLARWWRIYDCLGPAAGFMRATLSGEMFLEQKLLMGVSFAESYHRELHDSKRQGHLQRIATLIARAHKALPQAPGLNAELAKALIITRDGVAHLSRALDGKALQDEDLFYAVHQLQLVIQINLLLDLGLTQQLVRALVVKSYGGGRQVPLTDYRGAD
jgi:hypothetical protein